MRDFFESNKNELKLLAAYSWKNQKEHQNVYSNRIFWEGDKLYATNGGAFLYTTIDENPDRFSVIETYKKMSFNEDNKKIEELEKLKLYDRIIERFNKFDFSFDFIWNQEVPLPSKLASPKNQRFLDKMLFDFEENNLQILFNKGSNSLGGVTADYGDLFFNMQGEKPESFRLPLWELLELLKAVKKGTIHCEIGSLYVLGDKEYYIRMTADKWICIAMEVAELQ